MNAGAASFRISRAAHLDEAARILDGQGPDTMPLAGGTDLLPNMKRRQQVPRTLMSLRYVESLNHVQWSKSAFASRRLPYAHRHRRGYRFSKRYDPLYHKPLLWSHTAHSKHGHARRKSLLDTRCNYYDQNYEWRKRLIFA